MISILCSCSNIMYFGYNRRFIWAILDIQWVYWIQHDRCLCWSTSFRACCSHLMIALYEKVRNEIVNLMQYQLCVKTLLDFYFFILKNFTQRNRENFTQRNRENFHALIIQLQQLLRKQSCLFTLHPSHDGKIILNQVPDIFIFHP